MQQIHKLMAHMKTKLKKLMKMAEMITILVVEKRATRYHFRDNYTSGLMVNAITRGVVVAPRQKATKKMKIQISNPTGAITIFTTVTTIKMPCIVGQTVK